MNFHKSQISNRRWLLAILLAVSVALTASAASARRYGGGGGGATPASAYMSGMGTLIRSQAQANLTNAQAAIAAEQARTLYIQNRMLATNTYFQMRQANRDYVAAERGPKTSNDEFSRYSTHLQPKRLTASQLDPVTGHINWTPILQGENYALYREQIETLFKMRAEHHVAAGESSYSDIREAGHQMQAELTKHISNLAPQEYTEAHKFVEGLIYEAHFPVS